LTFRLRFEKNFYSIKENIKNYLKQIKNLSDANNDDSFKILIKLFVDYLKIVTKFVLILLPIIIYILISIFLKIEIIKIFTSLKINLFIILIILIYIYLRKKIVRNKI
tara:strand:+ start:1115 stop:1438 length:324 start_codon:yes stop_codon:yes gene_type:complete